MKGQGIIQCVHLPLSHLKQPQNITPFPQQAIVQKYLLYINDMAKKESAGRAAAVGNIDCGSREVLRRVRSLPRRMPPFFSEQSCDQHAKQKCEEKH